MALSIPSFSLKPPPTFVLSLSDHGKKSVSILCISSYWISHQTTPPKSPIHGCSQFILHPAHIHVWDCPNPVPGPCAWPYSHHEVWAHLLGLSRFLRMASLLSSMSTASSSLVSSANVLMLSISLSVSPTKLVNKASPSTDSWGMLFVTGLHLKFRLQTATFWMQTSSHFLIHRMAHPSNSCFSHLETRMSCETVPKGLCKPRKIIEMVVFVLELKRGEWPSRRDRSYLL